VYYPNNIQNFILLSVCYYASQIFISYTIARMHILNLYTYKCTNVGLYYRYIECIISRDFRF